MNISSIFGAPKERRTQLILRDDGKFEFRKLRIIDTFMVLLKGDVVLKGWKHFYRLQFPFAGYKSIRPDMVTIAYDRDIILDPFNIIKEGDKPGKNKPINENKWISDVAETQRYKHQSKPSKQLLLGKVTLFLGIGTILFVLAGAARAVWG